MKFSVPTGAIWNGPHLFIIIFGASLSLAHITFTQEYWDSFGSSPRNVANKKCAFVHAIDRLPCCLKLRDFSLPISHLSRVGTIRVGIKCREQRIRSVVPLLAGKPPGGQIPVPAAYWDDQEAEEFEQGERNQVEKQGRPSGRNLHSNQFYQASQLGVDNSGANPAKLPEVQLKYVPPKKNFVRRSEYLTAVMEGRAEGAGGRMADMRLSDDSGAAALSADSAPSPSFRSPLPEGSSAFFVPPAVAAAGQPPIMPVPIKVTRQAGSLPQSSAAPYPFTRTHASSLCLHLFISVSVSISASVCLCPLSRPRVLFPSHSVGICPPPPPEGDRELSRTFAWSTRSCP